MIGWNDCGVMIQIVYHQNANAMKYKYNILFCQMNENSGGFRKTVFFQWEANSIQKNNDIDFFLEILQPEKSKNFECLSQEGKILFGKIKNSITVTNMYAFYY